MKQLAMPLVGLVLVLLMGASCNKPSEVDLDIFDDQQINVLSSDTFTIKAKTVVAAPPRTRDVDQNLLGGLLLGNFNDPVFGNVQSDVYIKFLPLRILRDSFLFNRTPDFLTVDSVVLSLAYRLPTDSTLADNYYGYGLIDANEPYKLEVYKVTELINESEECLSDKSFAIESTPYLTKEFVPDLVNNIDLAYISNAQIDSVNAPPQLRIPMDNSFAEDLLFLLDAPLLDVNSTLTESEQEEAHLSRIENEILKGLCFKIVEPTGGIISISPSSPYTAINIFFKTDESYQTADGDIIDTTLLRQLALPPSRFYHTNFRHDYTGSQVEAFINSDELGDSLLYLQSMQGLEIELEMPYLEDLKNIIVNKATLEFTAIQPAGEVEEYYPPPILVQILETIDGDDFPIEDLAILQTQSLSEVYDIYGGIPIQDEDNQRIFRYSMNLTTHLQRIINGEKEAKLKLSPAFGITFANRLVFAGNNHPDLKPRLEIAYTDLN